MGRNIVVLADGTGNSAAKAFKTNVWRLYQALDLTGSEQIAAFSDGVGTSDFRPFAVIGWRSASASSAAFSHSTNSCA